MNKEWSEQNKRMQTLLKKATFPEGVRALIALRESLAAEMRAWRTRLPEKDFAAMPFPRAEGYHSKTVAYSIWHIIRIEDIVVNSLIGRREEVFFSGGFQEKTASPIVTTGNELTGKDIADFSAKLRIDGLYEYMEAVRAQSDAWLRGLAWDALKQRFTDDDKARLRRLQVVSPAESAAWLVDYWCDKDVAGLLKMPLSRHWIMHIEAANRIIAKLEQPPRR